MGDARRTTDLGPLAPDAAVTDVGAYPGRPGMHVATTMNDTFECEVAFKLEDLA